MYRSVHFELRSIEGSGVCVDMRIDTRFSTCVRARTLVNTLASSHVHMRAHKRGILAGHGEALIRIVMAYKSYGIYGYGQCRHGLYSYGLYRYSIYSYGFQL